MNCLVKILEWVKNDIEVDALRSTVLEKTQEANRMFLLAEKRQESIWELEEMVDDIQGRLNAKNIELQNAEAKCRSLQADLDVSNRMLEASRMEVRILKTHRSGY